jgi:hypothetical protein
MFLPVHAHVCSTEASCSFMGPRWLIYPILTIIIPLSFLLLDFMPDVQKFALLSHAGLSTILQAFFPCIHVTSISVFLFMQSYRRSIYSVKRKSGCLSPIGACVLPSCTKVLYFIKLFSLFPSLRALFSHKQ